MLYTFIWLNPLFIHLILFYFGRLIGFNGCALVLSFFLPLQTFSAYFIFFNQLCYTQLVTVHYTTWFIVGSLSIDFSLLFDSLSITMMLLITTVSLGVSFYSAYYMNSDPYILCFLSYIALFTFFMLILITSSNLLIFLVG